MIDGQLHFPRERDVEYSRIFLGAAWPAARAGWGVVVGESQVAFVAGRPRLEVLDEVQDERLDRLVARLAALRQYYRPESVLGDASHVAAVEFCLEHGLRLDPSPLCQMEGPMGYVLPVLRRMVGRGDEGRLRIPEGSTLRGEMMIPPSRADPATLELADYPAVAALAFAAMGLEMTREDSRIQPPTELAREGKVLR